jgi:methylenetetrahydrofolate reductase (NADPH)
MDVVHSKPHMNAHAVDSHGTAYCSGAKGVTALTWGVFPNKEIIQPTVFDSDTFIVWSEEAFQLWQTGWTDLYDDETESSALLYDMHDKYFLVAIIDNDYIESDLYSVFTEALVEQARRVRDEKEREAQSGMDSESF